MRLAVSVLCIVLLSGLVCGDEEVARVCPVVPAGDKSMQDELLDMDQNCFGSLLPALKEEFKTISSTTIENRSQLRPDFKIKCEEQVLKYKRCLVPIHADSEVCLNKTGETRFKLFSNFMAREAELYCVNDAEYLFFFIEASIDYIDGGKPNIIHKCRMGAYATVERDDADDSINSSLKYEYRLLQHSVQCLEKNRDQYDEKHINAGLNMNTELINSMTCRDVEHEQDVLCKTIFVN